ncbi:CHAP domain-containing protein [Actinoallomurus purpureus]|uniref:CHAP domain-containing protein n=1 Tax=Actinoallomurus purpureus TaxID=478114 RepID=UPI0020935778|nr:CHAP domain-containing protein [Actinoallomurus purpureus]MCO6009632.1 CHAP domain-containing protein [Actinoallomurus purpureus]
MSPRHAKPRRTPKSKYLAGLIAGTATAGAAAITMVSAGPAVSAQVPSTSRPAVQHVGQIPAPGTGTAMSADALRDYAHVDLRPLAAPKQAVKKLPAAVKKLPSAGDVLKLAQSQVGTTENAAGGSKFNQWFMSTPYAKHGVQENGGSISDYANASWCDMFVSWVGDQLGVKGMGADAFTPTHAKWFISQGRWGNVPKPGAVVFFSWSGGGVDGIDHVGLVIKDNHDGTIQTVEGNTDDAVRVRTRTTSSVVGYGYPQYAQ